MKEADPKEGPEKGILGRRAISPPRLWGGWVRYWRDEWDVSGALVLSTFLHSTDVSIQVHSIKNMSIQELLWRVNLEPFWGHIGWFGFWAKRCRNPIVPLLGYSDPGASKNLSISSNVNQTICFCFCDRDINIHRFCIIGRISYQDSCVFVLFWGICIWKVYSDINAGYYLCNLFVSLCIYICISIVY